MYSPPLITTYREMKAVQYILYVNVKCNYNKIVDFHMWLAKVKHVDDEK
jgi:hypothetical protein